jgi:hypothetical protein
MADTNKNGQTDYDETSRLLINSEAFRTCSMAFNSAGYTPSNEYVALHHDTIANDGDGKGRDPKDGDQQNPNIGTPKDVSMRKCLTAKNTPTKADDGWTGYNCAQQYCAGSDLV